MRRLLFVYNPHSSSYIHVKQEIFPYLTKIQDYVVGKFAIKKLPFKDNMLTLKKFLQDDDIVIAVGGDATAAVAANAILASQKNVTLGVLPYGNFNDLARTLGTMKFSDMFKSMGENFKPAFKTKKLYPLSIKVDGRHWRYATCYTTIGMTAESVELFDNPKIRQNLKKGHRTSWRSYIYLATWYFKNRHSKIFLPPYTLNGKPTSRKSSDYCALSGKSMCRVMKGGDDYLKPKVFRSENCKLTSFWRLFILMAKSILVRTPGTETTGDKLEFIDPATVEIQAEGEYQVFKNIKTIEVEKDGACLKVIHG